jgi:heme/copper-type cytochrome/quinol oxidase subunit 2
MNRYQGAALVGAIAVVLLVVCLIAWAVYLVREARHRRAKVDRLVALREAQWERNTFTKNGVTHVTIQRIARWGHFLVEEIDEAVTVGSVKIGEPRWLEKLDELKSEADQRVFSLNLELSG